MTAPTATPLSGLGQAHDGAAQHLEAPGQGRVLTISRIADPDTWQHPPHVAGPYAPGLITRLTKGTTDNIAAIDQDRQDR